MVSAVLPGVKHSATPSTPSTPFLGVLMLDTHFPRPPGDVGNPLTFERHGMAVRRLTIDGASVERIVKEADPALLQPFVDGALRLEREGAAMLTTSCGFLAAYQQVLSDAVSIPVVTSSLLQCREFARPGILTFDARSMRRAILDAAGVPPNTPVQGMEPGCEFHRRILNDDTQLDVAQAERDVVDAALCLVQANPAVEDIVMECTNMPPYRDAVARATGRRVHDIETLLVARWRALGS